MGKVKSNLKFKRKTFFREWRKFRGFTLEKLAERIGVTAGAISQLERGDISYTQPMLEALADALNCEPADLLMRNPLEPESPLAIINRLKPGSRKKIMNYIKRISEEEDRATGT